MSDLVEKNLMCLEWFDKGFKEGIKRGVKTTLERLFENRIIDTKSLEDFLELLNEGIDDE